MRGRGEARRGDEQYEQDDWLINRLFRHSEVLIVYIWTGRGAASHQHVSQSVSTEYYAWNRR